MYGGQRAGGNYGSVVLSSTPARCSLSRPLYLFTLLYIRHGNLCESGPSGVESLVVAKKSVKI